MSNKCINKKFNGVLDNVNVRKMNDIVMHVRSTELADYNKQVNITVLSYDINGDTIQAPVIRARGGKIIINNVEYESYTMTLTDVIYNTVFEVENKDYDVIVENSRYALMNLYLAGTTDATLNKPQIIHFDISQMNYCNIRNFTASRVSGGVVTGKLSYYNGASVYSLEFGNNNSESNPASVDVNSLVGSTNMTKFVALLLTNSTGNIINLAGNKSITRIAVPLTGITGDVDAFAAAQVTAGRTSGSVTIEAQGTEITCSVTGSRKVWRVDYGSGYTGGYQIVAI